MIVEYSVNRYSRAACEKQGENDAKHKPKIIKNRKKNLFLQSVSRAIPKTKKMKTKGMIVNIAVSTQ